MGPILGIPGLWILLKEVRDIFDPIGFFPGEGDLFLLQDVTPPSLTILLRRCYLSFSSFSDKPALR